MIGLIGKKEGMTQFFNDEGNLTPVSVIKIDKNVVIGKKDVNKDGYNAVVIGIDDLKEKKVIKSYKGIFKGVNPKRHLKEYRIDNPDQYQIGQEIGVEFFDDIKYIDVSGKSKGKGFQGVIKRHNFSGGPGGHGSKFHRHNGSTGQNTFPGRVHKGLKRAGRMGYDNTTTLSLKVVKVDKENNLLIVKGSVPGTKKSVIYIRKAVKKN